ncbi:MAG: CopG family antitoxin [Bacteroidales bacterium]|nr:hypothetical protein [Bacteroidales bacterium]MBS3773808.1 hypothetical protein [Bacteroidales bacterium]
MKRKYISAKEFDEKFEAGEDLSEYLDMEKANRPGLKNKKIRLQLPEWMLGSVDREAKKMGVSRQAVLRMWISEKLKNQTY